MPLSLMFRFALEWTQLWLCVCACTLIQETKWKRYWSDYTYCKWDIFLFAFPFFFFFCRFCSMPVCRTHCFLISHFSFANAVELERERAITNYVSFFVDGFMEMTLFYTYTSVCVYAASNHALLQMQTWHKYYFSFDVFLHNLSRMPLLPHNYCCCLVLLRSPIYRTKASIEHIDLILINQFFWRNTHFFYLTHKGNKSKKVHQRNWSMADDLYNER